MLRIPTDQHRTASRDALSGFLESCREEAESDGRARFVSISLAVRHIDPLAVLDSIYEPQQWHFYLENPSRKQAIAGAEAIELGTFSGTDRFLKMRDRAAEVFDRCIAIGDLEQPLSGPHLFCGFTFSEESAAGAAFPAATLFLPRWQVGRQGEQYVAVANSRVEPTEDVEALTNKIWAAHDKFKEFDYSSVEYDSGKGVVSSLEVGPEHRYIDIVGEALQRIRNGAYDKVVLARARDLLFDMPCQPLRTLNQLRVSFPDCYSFSFENGQGVSFIGASPERLIEVNGGSFCTEAIAGSVPRGGDDVLDRQLAKELMKSEKNLREHKHVIDSIRRRLSELNIVFGELSPPELLQLGNIQHLRTPIVLPLPEDKHILEIASVLHPTPAVGGSPREAALPDISRLEPFDRGLYAGLVGWFDSEGNGELIVAIRSALVDGCSARLYAGAGIVEGSDPMNEYQETATKMKALLDSIC